MMWKSSFEIMHGRKPDYNFMKSFGCLCYVTNTYPHKIKFDEKALKCIFLGYLPSLKLLKHTKTHKIHISRDVLFYETISPYTEKSATTTCPVSSNNESCTCPLPISEFLVDVFDSSDD